MNRLLTPRPNPRALDRRRRTPKRGLMGKGDHSGRRPEPDACSVPRRHAARASIRPAVYTRGASAAVSLVDASGVVTSAIMACCDASLVLHDGRAAQGRSICRRTSRPNSEKREKHMAKLTQFGLDAPIAPPGDARHKRSFPRVPSQLGQHDEEVESPLPNAWP